MFGHLLTLDRVFDHLFLLDRVFGHLFTLKRVFDICLLWTVFDYLFTLYHLCTLNGVFDIFFLLWAKHLTIFGQKVFNKFFYFGQSVWHLFTLDSI